jgi:hypothetical protein
LSGPPAAGADDFGVVVAGADGGPQVAHAVLGEAGLFKRLLDVAGALPGPGYIAKSSGRVVEGVDADARVVGAGQVGIAGAEAGSENAEVLVALLLKPVKAAADIDDSLAAGHECTSDVGADGVVGALQLGGAANVVVRHGEPQRGDAHAIEDGAEGVVAEAVGVPLRQHNDGLLGPRRVFVRGGRIPAGVYQVVFRIGRAFRRGEAQELGRRKLSFRGLLTDRGFLGQSLRADIGGKQLGVAFFEAEVGGRR